MKTLLTSLIMALTTFFVAFSALTLRSTQDDAAMFWQLERLAHDPGPKAPAALNQFSGILRTKARDPDLRTCADHQYRRSMAMLRLGFESYQNADDSVAIAGMLLNGWKRPSGLLLLADAMTRAPAAESARLNCLGKFSRTEADRINAAIAGLAAVLTFPVGQAIRRYQITRMGNP